MTASDIAILSLACTITGVAVAKIWFTATQFTTMKTAIDKTRQDINTVGKLMKDNDRKANRRYQQMSAALLRIHATEPSAVEQISEVLKADSWE